LGRASLPLDAFGPDRDLPSFADLAVRVQRRVEFVARGDDTLAMRYHSSDASLAGIERWVIETIGMRGPGKARQMRPLARVAVAAHAVAEELFGQ
jgi:hypothetical protein